MLIARIYPLITVYTVKGGQRKGSKHIINFPQSLNRLAIQLPRLPGDVPLVVRRSNRQEGRHYDFRVRRDKVRACTLIRTFTQAVAFRDSLHFSHKASAQQWLPTERDDRGSYLEGLVLNILVCRRTSSTSTRELNLVPGSIVPIDPTLHLFSFEHSPPYLHAPPLVKAQMNPDFVVALIETYWEHVYEFCPVFPRTCGQNFLTRYFGPTRSSCLLDSQKEPVLKAMLLGLRALGSLFQGKKFQVFSYFMQAQIEIKKFNLYDVRSRLSVGKYIISRRFFTLSYHNYRFSFTCAQSIY